MIEDIREQKLANKKLAALEMKAGNVVFRQVHKAGEVELNRISRRRA